MGEDRARELWKTALGELQLQVTRPYYETYLKSTVGLALDKGQFTIGAPTSFAVEWLCLRMRSRIEETLRRVAKGPVQAQFILFQGTRPTPTPRPEKVAGIAGAEEEEYEISGPQRPPSTNLNYSYTFANFVVGGFNRLAHAAATKVSEEPGLHYSPLFIYSAAGLGKTHLLQAIGNTASAAHKQVLYVSAEQFTNDLVTGIREKTSGHFRDKYRKVDVLLVDDIQFICGKEQTQEWFYHTFNHLHNANKQMVLAGDCHPRDLPMVEPRLVSRFEGGMLADIRPPDLASRIDILQVKAVNQGVVLALGALDTIARQAKDNVRALEGALNRVITYGKVKGVPLTTELVVEALAGASRQEAAHLTPDSIVQETSSFYRLSQDDLRSKGRKKELVLARDIAIFLLREELHLNPVRIGMLLGDRTPTAINSAIRKIASRIQGDQQLQTDISKIRDSIYTPVT